MAPPAAAPATAPATSTGFSFATAAPPGATPSAAAPGATAGQQQQGQQQQQANAKRPTFVVPPFETVFPYSQLHSRLRGHLDRIGGAGGGGDGDGTPASSCADSPEGQELIRYLTGGVVSVYDPAAATQSGANASANDEEAAAAAVPTREIPVGVMLSNPDPMTAPTQRPGGASGQAAASATEGKLRDELRANPYVLLRGKLTALTAPVYREISSLSEELDLTFPAATALYAEASSGGTREWLRSRLDDDGFGGYYDIPDHDDHPSDHLGGKTGDDDVIIPRYARELYFYERSCLLESTAMLVRHRLASAQGSGLLLETAAAAAVDTPETTAGRRGAGGRENAAGKLAIVVGTDHLLRTSVPEGGGAQAGNLISNLIGLVETWTKRADGLSVEIGRMRGASSAHQPQSQWPPGPAAPAQRSSSSSSSSFPSSSSERTKCVSRAFAWDQRGAVAECLFHVLYHTQATCAEVALLIDRIAGLTNGDGGDGSTGGGRGLPVLDPVRDVPSVLRGGAGFGGVGDDPYLQRQRQQGMAPPAGAEEVKSRTEWTDELVDGLWEAGGPQLLGVVSSLVASALCALDGSHVLLDRDLHGPNAFGVGNALLPPPECGRPPPDALQLVHDRLVDPPPTSTQQQGQQQQPQPQQRQSWDRMDIWALLSSSYALLLQPVAMRYDDEDSDGDGGGDAAQGINAPGAFHSPAAAAMGGARRRRPRSASAEAYSGLAGAFRRCLSHATRYRALTFARTSLLQSWGVSSAPVGVSAAGSDERVVDADIAFLYTSTLAEFASHYVQALDDFNELPISRKQWRSDTESELELSRVHEEQRRQISATLGEREQERDGEVYVIDFAKRPDCMDDVVALVVWICASCPPCSSLFWRTEGPDDGDEERRSGGEDDGRMQQDLKRRKALEPSNFVVELEQRVIGEDSSLFPSYLSLLGALALAATEDEEGGGNSTAQTNEYMDSTPTGIGDQNTAGSASEFPYDVADFGEAHDGAGAFAVHCMLRDRGSGGTMSSPASSHSPSASSSIGTLNWRYLICALQWHVDELLSNANSSASSRTPEQAAAAEASSSTFPSSSYYYGSGDTSSGFHQQHGGGGGYYYGPTYEKQATPPPPAHRSRETVGNAGGHYANQQSHNRSSSSSTLNEERLAVLLSLLNLITTVVSRSVTAQHFVLNTFVPPSSSPSTSMDGGGGVTSQSRPFTSPVASGTGAGYESADFLGRRGENVLSILFSLLAANATQTPTVARLPVDVKGAILTTLAVLVRNCSKASSESWDLLEMCQLLGPTSSSGGSAYLLSRSPMVSKYATPTSKSTAKSVALGSIIYDMDNLEAHDGTYPATEGFFLLLSSLISSVGCPPSLGCMWRRPGCAPYVEYVATYVLPRCFGGTYGRSVPGEIHTLPDGEAALFFASPSDRYRLVSRALDVLAAVIVRYPVPPSSDDIKKYQQAGSTESASVMNEQFHAPLAARSEGDMNVAAAFSHYTTAVASAKKLGLCPHSLGIFFPHARDSAIGTSTPSTARGHDNAHKGLVGRNSKAVPVPTVLNVADFEDAARDFRDEWVTIPPQSMRTFTSPGVMTDLAMQTTPASTPQASGGAPSLPRPKSPGFTLLANILGGHRLLKELLMVLVEDDGALGVQALANEVNSRMKAFALFKSDPDYSCVTEVTAKSIQQSHSRLPSAHEEASQHLLYGLHYKKQALLEQGLLSSSPYLFPSSLHALFPATGVFGSGRRLIASFAPPNSIVCWRERCATTCMQILCASAARESQFTKMVQSSPVPLSIVPVLGFSQNRSQEGRRTMPLGSLTNTQNLGLEVFDVNSLYRLADLLQASAGAPPFNLTAAREPLPAVAEYVGYRASNEATSDFYPGSNMAQNAVSLLFYVALTLQPHAVVPAVCGRSTTGGQRLAASFANRLLTSRPAAQDEGTGKVQLPGVSSMDGTRIPQVDARAIVLDLLLTNLSHPAPNLTHVLLGFTTPPPAAGYLSSPKARSAKAQNCFGAILSLLQDDLFVIQSQTAALGTKSFELLYRLCCSSSTIGNIQHDISSHQRSTGSVLASLRKENFWFRQCQRYLCPSHRAARQGQPTLRSVGNTVSLFELICRNFSTVAGTDKAGAWDSTLHSLAWLMKGVAIELHSLMGPQSFSDGTTIASADGYGQQDSNWAQPTQCRQLLSLLFGNALGAHSFGQSLLSSPIIEALRSLPLRNIRGSSNSPPYHSLVEGATYCLPGPKEVYGGFKAVDLSVFMLRIEAATSDTPQRLTSEKLEEALQWATRWNEYVASVCASSHLANAWENLVSTAVVSCKSLLVGNNSRIVNDTLNNIGDEGGTLLDPRNIIMLTNAVALRLTPDEAGLDLPSASVKQALNSSSYIWSAQHHLSKQYTDRPLQQSQQATGGEALEATNALPLSVAALRLVDLLKTLLEGSERDGLAAGQFSEITTTCALLARAVTACGEGEAHNERAAILSYSLVLILPGSYRGAPYGADLMSSAFYSGQYDDSVMLESFLGAAVYLSSRAASTDDSKTAKIRGGKAEAIAQACRSGLTSLLATFDKVPTERLSFSSPIHAESSNATSLAGGQTFLARVFSMHGGASLTRMIRLLSVSNIDVTWTLIRIASCGGGAQILLDKGAPAAVLATATQVDGEDAMNSSEFGMGALAFDIEGDNFYGTKVIEPPPQLLAQLKLLSTMLSVLPHARRLAVECAGFLRCIASIGDRLIRSFPRDGDVTENFVTLLAFTSATLSAGDQVNVPSRQAFSSDVSIDGILGRVLPALESRVLQFALHVAAFPFPDCFMPPLPRTLQEADRAQMARLRQVSVGPGRSWWDLLPSNRTEAGMEDIVLPNPPTVELIPSYGSWNGAESDHWWSHERYEYAILAAKTLEMALSFLKDRAKSRNGGTLALDGIALSKAICRCSDASRAIEIYLGSVNAPELENAKDDEKMIEDNQIDASLAARQIEREDLLALGPLLGRSTESLLILASLQMRCLSRDLASTGGASGLNVTRMSADEFAKALQGALEYTQVEQMGVGCVSLGRSSDAEKDFGRKVARHLREQVHSLLSSATM